MKKIKVRIDRDLHKKIMHVKIEQGLKSMSAAMALIFEVYEGKYGA